MRVPKFYVEKYTFLYTILYNVALRARLEARHAKVSGSSELSQPRWLAVSTRPLVGLRIRLLPSFSFAVHLHLSAREGIVRANHTLRTRRRGHGALCLSSARNLLRSLVKRTCPGRKETESYGEKRCQDVYDTILTIAYGRFPAHIRHIDSIYCTSIFIILFVMRDKKLQSFSRETHT